MAREQSMLFVVRIEFYYLKMSLRSPFRSLPFFMCNFPPQEKLAAHSFSFRNTQIIASESLRWLMKSRSGLWNSFGSPNCSFPVSRKSRSLKFAAAGTSESHCSRFIASVSRSSCSTKTNYHSTAAKLSNVIAPMKILLRANFMYQIKRIRFESFPE